MTKTKKQEKVVFFTFVSDNYYYAVGTHKMINSFKRFHSDIDLVIFRQDIIDKVFKETGRNFYNAKPTFAKILAPHYDLVVNIDADTVVLDRLEAVLKQDYDIGSVMNFNDYENRSIENVTEEMFLNAGLVASRNKKFWDIWEKENEKAMDYTCKENDILNLIVYNHPEVKKMKLKVFDKDKGYYGCKSLGRETKFEMKGEKVMCKGEQVFAYHHAKGAQALPKLDFKNMYFPKEVIKYMEVVSFYGKSERYSSI